MFSHETVRPQSVSALQATNWEFWPPWLFYAPVAAFVAALGVRYGWSALPAANPGLQDGGLVGESKFEILRLLPPEWTIASLLLPAGTSPAVASIEIATRGWSYPLVAKPDIGQRGVGVKRLHNEGELAKYLESFGGAVLIQPWHPGPFEAGIFYARWPGVATGQIFSITDKRFPVLAGDGRSTIEQLIRRHPRFSKQAATFLRRHDGRRGDILGHGETMVLGEVGNHAQGAMFVDGAQLITSALEQRIDTIARHVPGFFVGRFDVRYHDLHAFVAGRDLAIVELNGVTAESTNIYDPSHTLVEAYATLFKQWHLVFRIGAANLARGVQRVRRRRLVKLAWDHLTDRRTFPV